MNVCVCAWGVTINYYHILTWLFLCVCILVSSVPSLFDSYCTRNLPVPHDREWLAGTSVSCQEREPFTETCLPRPSLSPHSLEPSQQHTHTDEPCGKNKSISCLKGSNQSESLSFQPLSPIQERWGLKGLTGFQGHPPSSNNPVPGSSPEYEGKPHLVVPRS